jgi:sugar lactone lactonase YvrE
MSNKISISMFSPLGKVFAAGLVATTLLTSRVQAQYVSTVISNGLNTPSAVTTDGNGNVYLTDTANNRVVQFFPSTGVVSTLAGSTSATAGYHDAVGPQALFNSPQGIVYDPNRGGLVVVDTYNQVLRLISITNGVGHVSTLTNSAAFSYPDAIAVDAAGYLYVTDWGDNTIRVLHPNNTSAILAVGGYTFDLPSAIAVDSNNNVWVADSGHNEICMVSNGVVQIMAGNGTAGTNDSPIATDAEFSLPSGLLWDNNNNILVISDTLNNTIRGLSLTNYQGTIGYGVQTLAGTPGTHGLVDGALGAAEFFHPFGMCIDSNASGYYIVDQGNNALRVLQPTEPPPPPTPVGSPVIGYVTFPLNSGTPSALFNPITQQISIFNNKALLAIEQLDPTVETYMSYGATGSYIPPPGTNTDYVSPFTAVDTGQQSPADVPSLDIPTMPTLTLEAISEATGRPSSAAVSVEIEYVTANPNIIGNDAADIVLSDDTTNAQMYYTLDGSSPTNDGSNGIGPITTGQTLALNITSNVTLTVRAFASGFTPSSFVTEPLIVSNFVGNQLTFGFASGVASTKYITSPGRTYVAPVTLTELPGTTIYTLQFDLTESGLNYPVGTNSWNFTSMMTQPTSNGYVANIPPGILIPNGNPTNFVRLPTGYITTNDLMELSWITLPGQTNLYPTTSQDLTATSLVQGHGFSEAEGQVVVGALSFLVPTNSAGTTYTIQATLPSASTFGSGTAPGEPTSVFIQAPTNGSPGVGSISALKTVTVTNTVSYLVGDVYPFTWFNAGEFGDTNLQNDDVVTTYESAVGSIQGPFNPPLANSDYFDAMDSAGSAYDLYDGSDSDINSMTNGNGTLDVNDVYVTLRRSLDTNLDWLVRTWSNGKLTVSTLPGTGSAAAQTPLAGNTQSQTSTNGPRYITVAADQVQSGGKLSVQVPVRVLGADPVYPLRVLMLNVELEPLDGSPAITNAVSFATGANLGSPTLTSSEASNNYAAAWLDSTVSGVSGTNIIGALSVTLPSNVTTNSAYLVHFIHFSASPNGLALFKPTVQDGLITVGNRSGSSWGDGIPDSWRLLWFGTVSNALSAADADPDGDGANNWQEYVAGTNPNDATSVFQFIPGAAASSSPAFTLQWSSVINKSYTIQSAFDMSSSNWTTLATNIPGTGQTMQWTDSNATGQAEFYRALVQ